ncbi:hypothetical protein HPP92_014420 [Vanilla planifolia]|uniref:Uncharacterized protein n=1 Tax=Vanilla planifolia TaxID=51239 RepID=A0A835QQ06_VANPL|nr:hypothetical protein HPP92_014420 [Vanilla planifolia]
MEESNESEEHYSGFLQHRRFCYLSMLQESSFCKHPIVEDEDDGSLFSVNCHKHSCQCCSSGGLQKILLGKAFAKITPACPIIADSITVNNLFDALTNSSGGQLHLLIYDKYLKCLNKFFLSIKTSHQIFLSAKSTGPFTKWVDVLEKYLIEN